MGVFIVDTKLEQTDIPLVNTIRAVTVLSHYVTVVEPDEGLIVDLMRSVSRPLLIFAGGVPEHLAPWLIWILKEGRVPVFIVVATPDYSQEWKSSPATIFTTAVAKGVNPWPSFEGELKSALGLS